MGNLGNCQCCNPASEYCAGLRATAVKRWAGYLPFNTDPTTTPCTTKYRQLTVQITLTIPGDLPGLLYVDPAYTPTAEDSAVETRNCPYPDGPAVTLYSAPGVGYTNAKYLHPTFTATWTQSLITPTEAAAWHPPGNWIPIGDRGNEGVETWFPTTFLTGLCYEPGYAPAYTKIYTTTCCLADPTLRQTTYHTVTDCCASDIDNADQTTDIQNSMLGGGAMTGYPCPEDTETDWCAWGANGHNIAFEQLLETWTTLGTDPGFKTILTRTISADGLTCTVTVGDGADLATSDRVATYILTLSDPYTLETATADATALLGRISTLDAQTYALCPGTFTFDCSTDPIGSGGDPYPDWPISDLVITEAPDCATPQDFTGLPRDTDLTPAGLRAQRLWIEQATSACGYIGFIILTKTYLYRSATWTRRAREQTHTNQTTYTLGTNHDTTMPTGANWITPTVLDDLGFDYGTVVEV